MVAQALRFKQFGWLAPRPSRYAATVNGTALNLPIVDGTPTAGVLTPGPFNVLVDGVNRAITSATVTGQNLAIVLTAAVTAGQKVVLNYQGDIGQGAPLKNAAGDMTPPFNVAVTNNTP